jgi:ABC-2 type transport system permease protein
VIQYLAADREDPTILRAKATPNGIRGYLIGKRGPSWRTWRSC